MAARKIGKEQENKAPEEDVKVGTPEENTQPEKKEEKEEKKAPKAKVYNFTSENKFLTVASLGIQFVSGKATTTSVEIARELVKISGVELVEE